MNPTFFQRRRLRNAAWTLCALLPIAWWVRWEHNRLGNPAPTTGYLLLAIIFVLAAYGLRKKLPFLPLGSSATWLQLHIYLSLGSVGLFLLHVRSPIPNGPLEALLASVYVVTVASGLFGLYLSRTVPKRLARVGEEVIYERIGGLQGRLRQQARSVVLETVTESGTTTLADFYTQHLFRFFEQPRGLAYQLRPSSEGRKALMGEMQDLRRYLSDSERAALETLFSLVRKKDDLDYHQALQRALKLWLFGHIALTCLLLLLGCLHGSLAHAFVEGSL